MGKHCPSNLNVLLVQVENSIQQCCDVFKISAWALIHHICMGIKFCLEVNPTLTVHF